MGEKNPLFCESEHGGRGSGGSGGVSGLCGADTCKCEYCYCVQGGLGCVCVCGGWERGTGRSVNWYLTSQKEDSG